ncbi:MAG: glycosyltransferase family A protein [Acidobacteriota bacterium]|nr:glycosyltransferase family A protein [Acidobacteriota bacterium]
MSQSQPFAKPSVTVADVTAADVTVVVPVGGAAPHWPRCVQSLARLDPPPGEIVVVLDGPNDGHAAQAAELDATVVVLDNQGGPARARNRGAERAAGELLLFLDSDIEAPPGLVAQVAALFNAHPEMAAVMGSYDDSPGDPGFVSQYRNLLHHHVHQTGREIASTFWAGCGAVRRSVFEATGGFDAERYAVPSIEDIELGSRWVSAGHTVRLAKDLQVKHLKRWTLGGMIRTDLWCRAVPWTVLMLGAGEMVNDLNVKTRDRLSVALAFLPLGLAPAALAAWLLLPGTGLAPALLAAAVLALILMVALNAPVFRFYRRVRGWLFAAGVVPLYWIYLLICGLGFGLGLLRHLLGRS